ELTEQKTEAAPTLDFNFESKAEKQVEVTETATESFVQVESIEASAESASVAVHDPLVQSFPDLQQLDEAELNLDLVEQYIELGAYESARELLKSSQTLLNAEQQQRSQNLLNQIAS
ncbi:MAG: FimV domain-containing protein, partial [Acinetobacter sp.]